MSKNYNIIGVISDNVMYFGDEALYIMKENIDFEGLISKQHMELMSKFDLGKKWEDAAKSPVLFEWDDIKENPFLVGRRDGKLYVKR